MPAILLEHESQLLANELRTRNASLARRDRQQPVVLRIEGDRRRFLLAECQSGSCYLGVSGRQPPKARESSRNAVEVSAPSRAAGRPLDPERAELELESLERLRADDRVPVVRRDEHPTLRLQRQHFERLQ